MPEQELMTAITENTSPDDYDGANPAWCLIGQLDRNCVPYDHLALSISRIDRVANYFKVHRNAVANIYWESTNLDYTAAVTHAAVILGQPATGEPQPQSARVSQNQGA